MDGERIVIREAINEFIQNEVIDTSLDSLLSDMKVTFATRVSHTIISSEVNCSREGTLTKSVLHLCKSTMQSQNPKNFEAQEI